MDGHFVPNLTFGPKMVADLHRATRLPLDVHLMIERPDAWVDRYVDAGASYLTVHVEASRDVPRALQAIRARGVRPGITLNPETPVEAILPYLAAVDLVLVMSVHPGFGGQPFIESALDKGGVVGPGREPCRPLWHLDAALRADGPRRCRRGRRPPVSAPRAVARHDRVAKGAPGPAGRSAWAVQPRLPSRADERRGVR